MKPLPDYISQALPFQAFLADMAVLGVMPVAEGGRAYAVIAARSNPRWWLLPLENARAAAAGLEMMQPITPYARLAKAAMRSLVRFAPRRLLRTGVLRLSGLPDLTNAFDEQAAHIACFTGTDGPHRKTAIQFMDAQGAILGYAKLSREDRIRRYVRQEAKMLAHVGALGLSTADVPVVLSFTDETFSMLVTDSRKDSASRVDIDLTDAHLAFLTDIASRTAGVGAHEAFSMLDAAQDGLRGRAGSSWADRLAACQDRLRPVIDTWPVSLAHGDFTPWNVFLQTQGAPLYVFDWEYAAQAFPLGYDLAHFFLSTRPDPDGAAIEALITTLAEMHYEGDQSQAAYGLLFALALHAVFYIQRAAEARAGLEVWGEACSRARLIDRLLARIERSGNG